MGVRSYGEIRRRAVECDNDFSTDVRIRVVVVVELRRSDAVADKYGLGFDGGVRTEVIASGDEVFAEMQLLFLSVQLQRE